MEVSYKTFTDVLKEISLRGNDNIPVSPNTHKSERNCLLNEKVSENEEQKKLSSLQKLLHPFLVQYNTSNN